MLQLFESLEVVDKMCEYLGSFLKWNVWVFGLFLKWNVWVFGLFLNEMCEYLGCF